MKEKTHVILNERLKLQWSTGDSFVCNMHGLECLEPYTFTIILEGVSSCRIDILKHELANELTAWLGGDQLEGRPALIVSKRIEEAMLNFIKFGRPPKQSDIYMWILSRTLILKSGTSGMKLVFGQVSSDGTVLDTSETDMNGQVLSKDSGTGGNFMTKSMSQSITAHETDPREPQQRSLPSSAPHSRNRRRSYDGDDILLGSQKGYGTHKLTQDILGTSSAISQLQTEKIKGREAARPTFVRLGWTEDHYRLTNDISSRRHEIEDIMERRRKVLEISKARQMKTTDKYRRIRETNTANRSNYNWARDASYEVTNLDRITAAVCEDIQRQKCQTERTTEHIRWTMAPNGFVNRRGRYTKGFVLGPGPLPANATTSLKDPRMEKTLNTYHWDVHGRRHVRRPEDVTPGSDIEKALALIRKAASNASIYKLNLKKVFQEMDVSGDGFVSFNEMRDFFKNIGMKIENRLLFALFRHFDPNDSGSIHYGEFCWAFFNRRSLVSQWKTKTKSYNDRQIKFKFQQADKNGNGVLNRKEFVKLLKSFSIKLTDMDIDLLMDRFDKDGDGELDLKEFTAFVDAEVNSKVTEQNITARIEHGKTRATVAKTAVRGEENTGIIEDEAPPEYDDGDDEDDNGRTSTGHLIANKFISTEKTSVADYNIAGSVRLTDVINPAQLSQIFSHQARIEEKLGEKYYQKSK